MSSRDKFKQAIKARFGDLIDYRTCKNSDGEYMAWDMQVAWWAWQAAETDMAVQLANAESKCRALAAELSAVDKIHNEAVFITDDHYEQCPPEVQKMIRSLAVLQIPAYDAFLAEVRASGADEVSAICRGLANKDGCSVNMQCSYNLTAERAEAVAAQLRKGAAL
ncbi:hypothetical protein [Citrobacter freundii]|uniref:hypothetical protein n=1 Tax=Citrobacter freundii TaxID=546 RepID=UPI002247CFCC|nr:hypothetical protein [Citrobacter freundii]MCX2442350.1 hypothetical protein [Citrobacter freundii]MCX2470802.1 hypothetical protein [Citrobacter freundii]UZQ87631.1 hypothetical protein OQW59_15525 [Citrobacter freundii]UZQ93969.1 hypothetical protein OQY67_19975 [Citrobacter freundii]UZQ98474.1 hypothetical protein OQZ20_15655 [Citrobacter freundii]